MVPIMPTAPLETDTLHASIAESSTRLGGKEHSHKSQERVDPFLLGAAFRSIRRMPSAKHREQSHGQRHQVIAGRELREHAHYCFPFAGCTAAGGLITAGRSRNGGCGYFMLDGGIHCVAIVRRTHVLHDLIHRLLKNFEKRFGIETDPESQSESARTSEPHAP